MFVCQDMGPGYDLSLPIWPHVMFGESDTVESDFLNLIRPRLQILFKRCYKTNPASFRPRRKLHQLFSFTATSLFSHPQQLRLDFFQPSTTISDCLQHRRSNQLFKGKIYFIDNSCFCMQSAIFSSNFNFSPTWWFFSPIRWVFIPLYLVWWI